MMTATKNTKAIYNTEIPSDWEEMNINEMFYFKQGVQCAVDNQFEICNESRVRFIRIIDLTDSNEPIRYIDDPGKEHHVLPDDLFMIRYGTPGVLGYGYEGVIANNLFRIIPKTETNNNHFFYYQLTFKERQIQKLSSSSTMPALNFESLSQLKVLVPPLSEQKAIAKVLSTADAAIQTTEKLITQKELHKKWLMQQLLTGKKRLKGFEGSWFNIEISHLFELIDRYVNWSESEKYKLISIRRRNGGAFFRESLYGYQIGVKKLKVIKVNDFLISKRQASHGAWTVVQNEHDNANVSDEYDCLEISDKNQLSPDFWKWYCQIPLLTHFANVDSDGVHIEKSIFDFELFKRRKIFIPPSINEQIAISNILQASDKEISLLKAKAEKLREQKKGLMQVLLTGKMRLKF